MAKLKIYLYCSFKYYFQEQSCGDTNKKTKTKQENKNGIKMSIDGDTYGERMEKGWRKDGVRME